MAYADKYKLEIADNLGIVWTVLIQEDDFAGDVIILNGTGSPLFFEFYGDDTLFDQNIMGSKASIGINCSTDFAYSELFTSENLKFKVIIKYSSTVFWNGWIMANNYQESYNCVPYPVSIVATDGLGILSDFRFSDLSYTTRKTAAKVIFDILSLVGVTTFSEFVNVYESTMDQAVGDSPFDQMGIDPDLFKTDDCYTALSEILKSFNAGIRQDQGAFIIYRFKELEDASMKGRIFTSATVKSATTRTPLQYINRDAQASNFWNYNGGTFTMIPQLKKLYVNQNYGFEGGFFKGYDFDFNDFIDTEGVWSLTDWDLSAATEIQPVAKSLMTSDVHGVWMKDASSAYDHYISQTVDIDITTEDLILEIECGGWAGNAAGSLEIELINVQGGYTQKYGYSYSTGTGSWVETEDPTYTQLVSKTYTPNVSVDTYRLPVDGIPMTGTLEIRLYNAISSGSDVYAIWRTVKLFTVDANGIMPEGIGYTVDNNISGQVIEKEILLGDGAGFDNDAAQFTGAINVWDSTTAVSTSLSWETVTAGTGNNEADPLIELISSEIAAQYNRPKQLLDIPIREMHDDEFLKLVGNIQDTSNKQGGVNRIFAPCHGTFDVKRREWNLTSVEII